MDPLFERLSRLIRSWGVSGETSTSSQSYDPDLQAAEEELEAYLNPGRNRPKSGSQGARSYAHDYQAQRAAPAQDPELKKAFDVFDLPYGAPWDEVNTAHKKLLMKFHPDRHYQTPQSQREATQISQMINEAYQKLKKHYGR